MAKKSVVGLVQSESKAEAIVNDLRSAGISTNDVSALFPEKSGTEHAAHEQNGKASEGAGAGAVIGGTLGLLAGIGKLAIPGLGSFIAAGPIKVALNGAAAGAASGIVGALIGMGLPENEARRYAGKIEQGNVLLSDEQRGFMVQTPTPPSAGTLLARTRRRATRRARS